jgi:hypothetical protein
MKNICQFDEAAAPARPREHVALQSEGGKRLNPP